MTSSRFDVAVLSTRPAGTAWRQFRAQVITGEHGTDLAAARWWIRHDHLIEAILLMVVTPAVPIVLLAEEITTNTILMSTLWSGSCLLFALVTLWWTRWDYWWFKTRARFRLVEFARVNGLDYQAEPTVRKRLAAHIFGYVPIRHHVDQFVVPGPCGFIVANYWEYGDSDSSDTNRRMSGYVVFSLRVSYPNTMVSMDTWSQVKALRHVEPLAGPAGTRLWCQKPDYPPLCQLLRDTDVIDQALSFGPKTQIEIVGNELFLLRPGGFWPIGSPRLWRNLETMADILAPFLAQETTNHEPSGLPMTKR